MTVSDAGIGAHDKHIQKNIVVGWQNIFFPFLKHKDIGSSILGFGTILCDFLVSFIIWFRKNWNTDHPAFFSFWVQIDL